MPFYLKHATNGTVELQEGPVLEPAEGQLLIKVAAVGGNPVDEQINAHLTPVVTGTTVGYDFAGTVHKSTNDTFPEGTRVAGFAFGACSSNHAWGAFGEYCIAWPEKVFKIPEHMSYEEAVTLPVGLSVAGVALSMSLDVKPGEPLFILGGSTSMGAIAIQYAKHMGASPIITVASAKNFDYVKSLGADLVVDYHDADCAQKIKDLTEGKLRKAFDARSDGSTFNLVREVLSPSGGSAVVLNPVPDTIDVPSNITMSMADVLTTFGVPYSIFGIQVPAVPAMKAFSDGWWTGQGGQLAADGKIRPHRVRVVEGGLGNVVKNAWALYRSGGVSAQKLVFRVGE